jgi:predicted amidohydrolase
MKMKLALAQLLVEGTEPDRNFERAEKLIARWLETRRSQ